jgi:LmbE family N-acetylglucosaminyl deacetylase
MTSLLDRLGRVLVIAPHADDEVLGCGGLIACLSDMGTPADVAIVTEGKAPAYSVQSVAALKQESAEVARILGVGGSHWLGLPAAALDTVPHAELNAAMARLVQELQPDTLLLPFPGDIHRDHQLVFQSAMVAVRPSGPGYPARVLCYETVSETNWNAPGLTPPFVPQLFVDIGAGLARKLAAFGAYASQVRDFPQERSVEALTALARMRGATVHRPAAEAFVLVREVG